MYRNDCNVIFFLVLLQYYASLNNCILVLSWSLQAVGSWDSSPDMPSTEIQVVSIPFWHRWIPAAHMVSTNTFCIATSHQNVRRKAQDWMLQSGVWAKQNGLGYSAFKVPPLRQLCAGVLCVSVMCSRTFWKSIGERCICEPYPLEKRLVFISVYDCVSFCFCEFIILLAHICISNRRNSLLKSLGVSGSIWGIN